MALREAVDTEFKKASGKDGKGAVPQDFWPTYSSFANTEGGEIFLGIEEQKPGGSLLISGIADPSRIKKELFDLANNREKTSINLLENNSVEEIVIEGKTILRIHVPRATRKQRPVYIGTNPLKGTYKRHNEGDYLHDELAIKKMLAEQGESVVDARILKGYGLDDLDRDSLVAYRNTFASLKPNHPFISQDTESFLRSIGAWGLNRETGEGGLTLAGLLMFGRLRSILDEVPHYILDYQERTEAKTEKRWIDRVTTDGSWSGNIYDFYRRAYQKLTADLKVPFKLEDDKRIEETPVHEALREALVNALIHADYSGRVSVLIIKRPDMFGFRNPGLMRVPIDLAIKGGDSDCRNRNLQKMFQFIGAGEQAGSGILKIYQNWKQQHWRKPRIMERREPEQTLFELHTVSLLPLEAIEQLEKLFGDRFSRLPELERLILVIAATEDLVDHKRVRENRAEHPADISKALSHLSKEGFLCTVGTGRGTSYYLAGSEIDGLLAGSLYLDVENSIGLQGSSIGLQGSSIGLQGSSIGLQGSSIGLQGSSIGLDLDSQEVEISRPAQKHKKLGRTQMEDIIVKLCGLRPQSLEKLAGALNRSTVFLRNTYMKQLVNKGKVVLLYPDKPQHPQQAYLTPTLRDNNVNAK